MKREVIFRGWSPTDGKWIYGSGVHSTPFRTYLLTDAGRLLEVEPETVGEWTGLHSNIGRKIFEGDVVEAFYFKDYYSGVVKYDDELGGFYIWFPEQKVTLPVYASHETQKVIGNIFDDPELKERFGKVWEEKQK